MEGWSNGKLPDPAIGGFACRLDYMGFNAYQRCNASLGEQRLDGRWGEVNGAHRPELDGCVDIETLGVGVSPQTYSRLEPHSWRYTSLARATQLHLL